MPDDEKNREHERDEDGVPGGADGGDDVVVS